MVEYASNGNLRDFLRERRPTNFFSSQQQQHQQLDEESNMISIDNLVFFASQIAKGMAFLTENNVSQSLINELKIIKKRKLSETHFHFLNNYKFK